MSGTARSSQDTVGMQGMVSPSDGFVEPDGTLTPIAFRFTWGVYQAIMQLKADVATIQQRLTNAGIP